jgi:hypothetical protein
MTEEEWLHGTQPKKMLGFVRGKYSTRKFLLFSCASCRRVWDRVTDVRSRHAVETAERSTDGLASEMDIEWARVGAEQARIPDDIHAFDSRPSRAAYACLSDSAFAVNDLLLANRGMAGRRSHASLLRDIFGNPFRPIFVDPACLTTDVVWLAQAAYDDRFLPSGELEHDRLAVLSDALEEAGCTDPDLLDHLRGPAPHVRGCWALDLILGKV